MKRYIKATNTGNDSIRSAVNIIYPWKMVGEYEDGEEEEVGGFDEEHCMQKLIDLQEEHGELTWYSGYSDEDYANGEYIGRENFVYD